MEISNQARSKVSKPNKLHAEKKMLGNIRYFPKQLVARWHKSPALQKEILAGVPKECDFVISFGHSFIMDAWLLYHFCPSSLRETKNNSQLAEETGESKNGLKLVHSMEKELLWEYKKWLSVHKTLLGRELSNCCMQCR